MRRRPAARRYRQRIVRLRQQPGYRSGTGEWVDGVLSEEPLPANVQPVNLDNTLETGNAGRLTERLRCFVPLPDALRAAYEGRQPDRVRYDGAEYMVEVSESWPGSHTRATLLREA